MIAQNRLLAMVLVVAAAALPTVAVADGKAPAVPASKDTSPSTIPVREDLALPDEAIPMLTEEDLPKRTPPLLELGAPLLDTGKIKRGIELPTGAVWNPSLWVFGAYRTSVNYIEPWGDDEQLLEWPQRLDLFFNLQLSGTERLLVGIQPLHRDGKFTTYTFSPDAVDGWQWEGNLNLTTIFFEGDFGEIFPKLDPEDSKGLDIGFAVGRQRIEFQDGIMFNDQMDSIGVTRNSISFGAVSNLRTTFLFGWNDIHRDDNVEDNDALVFGLFTEMDTSLSTIEIDLAYVDSRVDIDSGGDGFYWGVGSVQRFGFVNTSFRINGSHALDEESASVSDGALLFAEVSTSPRGTHDVVYCNAFWGIDNYSSAARDPTAGGPLGRTGLLFASVGLGRWRPALGNRADESWGVGLGYQRFWDTDRTQLVLEVGGRRSTADGPHAYAFGARVQRKLGRRYMLQVDGYVTEPDEGSSVFGLRTELLVRF